MEPRRIADLAQLPDTKFLEEVAKGLELVHENANRIWASVELLADEKHFRAAEILKNLALEEAAKYLILLDAVRSPRKPNSKTFSDQLRKFNSHLARGIYANVCDWRPANLREVREAIERECEAYYLDGPNEVDWIFRNDLKRAREEALYVDYVAYEDKHRWVSPKTPETMAARMFFYEPAPILLIRALHIAGFDTVEALAVIAQVWRSKVFTDNSRHDELDSVIREMLRTMDDASVVKPAEDKIFNTIIDRWHFPLYAFPMKIIEIDKEELKEIRNRWNPDAQFFLAE